MKLYLQIFIVTAVVFLIIDGLWLGIVAWPFYQSQVGHLLKNVNSLAATVFYVIYVIGMIVFVINPNLSSFNLKRALIMGYLFGAICYATYDLTNMSTLKDWTWKLTIVDIIWGGFVTMTTTSLVTYLFKEV